MDVHKRRTDLGRIRKKKHRQAMRRKARVQKQWHCGVGEREDALVARYTTTAKIKILPPTTKCECENAMYLKWTKGDAPVKSALNDYDILDYTSVLADEYEIVDAIQCC